MSELKREKRPFFVYGTLLPAQPNYFLWEHAILKAEKAIIKNCQLYDMGPYPMLVEQAGGQTFGMVMHIADALLDEVTANLDALEGYDPQNHSACAYKRVLRTVVLENGRFVEAWIYLGAKQFITNMSIIKSGDWRKYMQSKQNQISEWWETIESVAGLHHSEE